MAARLVYKLLTQTCAYSTNIRSISRDRSIAKQHRSFSQPPQPQSNVENPKEFFFQIKKMSKSLHNMKDHNDVVEDDAVEEQDDVKADPNTFPLVADFSSRDTAKKVEDNHFVEEDIEDDTVRYEVNDRTADRENFDELVDHLKKMTEIRDHNMFSHLQPSGIRPFGSQDNIHIPVHHKKLKVVYPVVNTTANKTTQRFELAQNKEYSSCSTKKVYPGYTIPAKLAFCESKTTLSALSSKNKRTSSLKVPTVNANMRRNSSSALVTQRQRETRQNRIEKLLESSGKKVLYQFYKEMSKQAVKPKKEDAKPSKHTISGKDPKDYCIVKLRDLQRQCWKQKKSKPQKITFGRLPKLPEKDDCICIDDIALKEGLPLRRLKKLFEPKEKKKICIEEACINERADDSYVIRKKTLPKLDVHDCPCEEPQMTDFVIKRLPKVKIQQPPRLCLSCEQTNTCCPPRADDNLKPMAKKLPPLEPSNCVCIEPTPLKDVPLPRLKPPPFYEPPKRVCAAPTVCEVAKRADEGKELAPKKSLPRFESDCVCVEQPPLKDVPPLRRLKKVKIPEPQRCQQVVAECLTMKRADDECQFLHKKKKLPALVPQNCPCIEPEIPSKPVQLRRLVKRPVFVKPRVCVVEQCPPRADDGKVLKSKKLPPVGTKDCPCIEKPMMTDVSLKRLVPKPVKEPKRICEKVEVCDVTLRADAGSCVEPKKLPALVVNTCPCIEPKPLKDIKPLARLKKRPVKERSKVCIKQEVCDVTARADACLTIKPKQLPVLEISDCPCIEADSLKDAKPLRRLKKVHVPEPVKTCVEVDICEEIPRADEDDWMYWKRAEVACVDKQDIATCKKVCVEVCDENQTKRHYSTSASFRPHARSYSTCVSQRLDNAVPIFVDDTCQVLAEDDADYVALLVQRNKVLRVSKSGKIKDDHKFISTCSALCDDSEKEKKGSCACPPHSYERYLQPKHPIIPEQEKFITPFPDDEWIENSKVKSQKFERIAQEHMKCKDEREVFVECDEKDKDDKEEEVMGGIEAAPTIVKEPTMWEKVVNYFKARPDCPSPEEYKKMRLREKAEKAAVKAGLCLYDPKEMLEKSQKELPKVITAKDKIDEK